MHAVLLPWTSRPRTKTLTLTLFCIPLDTNKVISETLFVANLSASAEPRTKTNVAKAKAKAKARGPSVRGQG